MDKNILSFVNKHYISFKLSNLILRVLSIFLISYGAIAFVEISSPFGYNSVNFFSNNVLPFTITLSCVAFLISIVTICLYIIKSQWSFILMRAITNCYISVLFLIASFFRFNGYVFSYESNTIIIAKIIIYLLIIPIDLFILIKWTIPKSRNHTSLGVKSLAGVLGVFVARLLIQTRSISVQNLMPIIAFAIAVVLLVNSVYFSTQSYYAKKYSINTPADNSPPVPERTLHNLK